MLSILQINKFKKRRVLLMINKMVINIRGGAKIVFDFPNIIKEWGRFYRRFELTDNDGQNVFLPQEVNVSTEIFSEAKKAIKKYGFDMCVVLPANISIVSILNNKKLMRVGGIKLRSDCVLTSACSHTNQSMIIFCHRDMSYIEPKTKNLNEKNCYGQYEKDMAKIEPKYRDQCGRQFSDWILQALFLHHNRIRNILKLAPLPLSGHMGDKTVPVLYWDKIDKGLEIFHWRHDGDFIPGELKLGTQFCYRMPLNLKIKSKLKNPPRLTGHPVLDFLNIKGMTPESFSDIG